MIFEHIFGPAMAQMASPVASHSFTSGLVASDPIQTGTEGINRIEVYFFPWPGAKFLLNSLKPYFKIFFN